MICGALCLVQGIFTRTILTFAANTRAMAEVKSFVFSPFQENTYVLYDETKECMIIDPGCYDDKERGELDAFIEEKGLTPVRLINTHCHLDHIFGNAYVADKYNLLPEFHEGEIMVMNMGPKAASMYGVTLDISPEPENYLKEGDVIGFGNTTLTSIFTPGHSPASLSFFCEKDGFLIAGDTLFYGSIGRTDLPGGDYATLIASIKDKLFVLGDEVVVYSGHMQKTTIGFERKNNPFLTGKVSF